MPNEYVLVATKPDASQVFWTWTGFSKHKERAARMISLDFADTTFQMERKAHPEWKFDLRIYEARPTVGCDECGREATNYVGSRDKCPTDRGVEVRSTKIYLCDDCREMFELRNR